MAPVNLERVKMSEADAWYSRNRTEDAGSIGPSKGLTVVMDELDRLDFRPASALEIGACDGYNLIALERKYGISATGLEISHRAVEAGNLALADLSLRSKLLQGSGGQLPFQDESFDLVCMGFMLYLADEELLPDYYREAFRVLKVGGIVAIWDFYPTKSKPVYHHDPEIEINKVDHTQAMLGISSDARLLSFTTLASEKLTSRNGLERAEMASLIAKLA